MAHLVRHFGPGTCERTRESDERTCRIDVRTQEIDERTRVLANEPEGTECRSWAGKAFWINMMPPFATCRTWLGGGLAEPGALAIAERTGRP
jgi:hypothetical protein